METRFLLAAVLAVMLDGCTDSYTVQEVDRQGLDVQRQALEAQDAEHDRLEAALKENPDLKTAAIMPIVERMREKNADALKISKQLLSNLGVPQQPIVYTHAEIEGLLQRMAKAHQVGFWAGLGAGILSVGLAVIGIAKSPFARLIPGVGTVLTALDSTMTAAEVWMQGMKDGGKPDVAAGLASVLEAANASHAIPAVSRLVDKKLALVQSNIGAAPLAVIEAAAKAAGLPVASELAAAA